MRPFVALLVLSACSGGYSASSDMADGVDVPDIEDIAADTVEIDPCGDPDVGARFTFEPPDGSVAPPRYYTLIISDASTFDACDPEACAASTQGAHGADIDAAELYDGTTLLGALAWALYEPGDACPIAPAFSDANAAKGAPDASASSGFVSLGGGTLFGEFTPSVLEILPGYTLVVYEVDEISDDGGGEHDRYTVSIATHSDCYGPDCSILLGEFSGQASIALSGF